MKLPDIPGKIMAQMAIAPQRKIKSRLVVCLGRRSNRNIISDYDSGDKT